MLGLYGYTQNNFLLKLEECSISGPKQTPNRKGVWYEHSSEYIGYHTKVTFSKSWKGNWAIKWKRKESGSNNCLIRPAPALEIIPMETLGRKPKSRLAICKAFAAKAIYRLETTDLFIEYLKGCPSLRRLGGFESAWQVPSKSTFSRAFT